VSHAPRPAGPVGRARAPGRVTLIGDHTDYNEGLSLPMAIDLATEASFTPQPGTFLLGVHSDQYPEPWELALHGAAPALPDAALAAGLLRLARPPSGGRLEVRSTVPLGAGLSSSASFSVAVLLALGADLGAAPDDSARPDPVTTALRCQEAEASSGAHVGLLDPIAICAAQAGHAVSIDFATLGYHLVPVPDDACFVVVHSETSRSLAASGYAERRAECERAAAALGRPLGLATLGDLSQIPDPVLRRRARHVVTECARVREVERLLSRGQVANLGAIGAVMTEGQRSLAEDYRSSVPAVDSLVEQLLRTPGVLGARMSGGGFGGCVIALCRPDSPALDPAHHAPRRAWRISPSAGATRLGR
jgi:galactokinase